MAAWTWRFEKADGAEVQPAVQPEEFTTQGDAESWLGEYWKDLLDGGAEQVRLFEDATEIYGPMSLHARLERRSGRGRPCAGRRRAGRSSPVHTPGGHRGVPAGQPRTPHRCSRAATERYGSVRPARSSAASRPSRSSGTCAPSVAVSVKTRTPYQACRAPRCRRACGQRRQPVGRTARPSRLG